MKDFEEFYENLDRFAGLSITDQISRTCWFLHQVGNVERFQPKDIADQFRLVHLNPPQVGVYLGRMASRKPALILKDRRGYYLEGRERRRLNDLFLPSKTTATVSKLLVGLIDQVSDGPERVFLDEAIRCYQVAAFRASIVMTWNLAYDYLRRWIIADEKRILAFNEGAIKRFSKSPKSLVFSIDNFDDFKESEFIDACSSGKIISKNLETMLREKLKRRNMAAHPSAIAISQPQADDVITDLVQNVILKLG